MQPALRKRGVYEGRERGELIIKGGDGGVTASLERRCESRASARHVTTLPTVESIKGQKAEKIAARDLGDNNKKEKRETLPLS